MLTISEVPEMHVGQAIVVECDGRVTRGTFLGLTRDADGPKLRLVDADRVEYRFPLSTTATHATA